MQSRKIVVFIGQAIVVGLAIAFLVTLFWPAVIKRLGPNTVEVRETIVPAGAPAGGAVSYALAVERAAPAVVSINTAKVVTVQANPLLNDPFFRQFFGRDAEGPRKRVENSLGSGVIFSAQGYILTNHHVIRGADAIKVFLRDGRSAVAKVVGTDPETDLAVLKIELPNLPSMTLGRSEHIRIGDVVLAIGNPYGVGQTVTHGIVSATGRSSLGINTFENFIQTDAAINPGNSGGALIDAYGNLIGINTAIFSQTGGSVGIGFAIPTSLAKGVMEQIIEHGRALRGWLGFEAQTLSPELLATFGLPNGTEGLAITTLYRNGPAHRAGVQPGDVLVAVDGKKATDARDVLLAITSHKPGDRIKLDLLRGGKLLSLEAVAAERPTSRMRR
jgi:serine protease DegS